MTLLVAVLLLIYTLVNYWGLKSLSKVNNTRGYCYKDCNSYYSCNAIIYVRFFHPGNFSAVAAGGFMPYGVGSVFSAVVNSGIFYAFFGFQFMVIFSKHSCSYYLLITSDIIYRRCAVPSDLLSLSGGGGRE